MSDNGGVKHWRDAPPPQHPGGGDPPSRAERRADAKAEKARAKAMRPWYRKKRWWLVIAVGLFVLFSAVGNGTEPVEVEREASNHQEEFEEAIAEEPAQEEAQEPSMTVAQEQAVQSAQSYVDGMAFSKAGLLEQLTSDYGEGFDEADAKFAVNHIDVDWNQEAVESAESYLEMGGFSRESLMEQLTLPAGEQFTRAQAEYAVEEVGL